MTRSLLVYDASNPLYRAVGEAVALYSDEIRPVPWGTRAVQAFLEAQFDDRPFALVLVDGDTVHVGADSVGEVLGKLGVPGPAADLLEGAYPAAAPGIGRLLHGRPPADLHGSYPLEDDARAYVDSLVGSRTIPVESR